MSVDIIPAILTNNASELKSMLGEVDESVRINETPISRVQIDIIDGVFADNITVDPLVFDGVETDMSLDFHLMVKEPVNWVEKSANAGADRIIGQIEMMNSQLEFLKKVQETGLYVGLAIDLDTPVSALDPLILTNLDVVLLMAVKAGWGGQKFNYEVLEKIKELDDLRSRDATPFKICVDGGETEDTVDETHFAGADEIVIGRRLFVGNIHDNIKKLQAAAHDLV